MVVQIGSTMFSLLLVTTGMGRVTGTEMEGDRDPVYKTETGSDVSALGMDARGGQ